MNYDAATAAIVEHARAGVLRAAARQITFQSDRAAREYQVISPQHWRELTYEDLWGGHFWNNGIIKEYGPGAAHRRAMGLNSNNEEPTCTVLGVRFEPGGLEPLRPKREYRGIVRTIADGLRPQPAGEPLPAAAKQRPATAAAPKPAEEPTLHSATKDDPHISEATLKAWWAMCLTLRSAEAWTHDDIRAFYDRCFPDKYLSRDRQRALRDKAKSGPKGRAAE